MHIVLYGDNLHEISNPSLRENLHEISNLIFGDNLHEIPNPIFYEKKKNKKKEIKILSVEKFT